MSKLGILERDEPIVLDSKIKWVRARRLKLAAAILVLLVPFFTSSCMDISEAAMPNLVGLSLKEAKDVLDGIGMKVDLNYLDVKSDRLVIRDKNWKVVKQEPLPDKVIKKNEIVCLSLIKLEESTFLDLGNRCSNLIIEKQGLKIGETGGVEVVDSILPTNLPVTADSALGELIEKLGIPNKPPISESVCGQFTFLIKRDGSHQFYQWSDEIWKLDVSVKSLFPPTMTSVEAVDVTGDGAQDFLVSLPSWDPLANPRPRSGAVLASINCEWQWLTFRTTTKEDWYQLDNLSWDADEGLLFGGDEITDMDSPTYDGQRETELRYFKFKESSLDFRLTGGVPQSVRNPSSTEPPIVVPPGAISEATFMCGTKLTEVISAYEIVNLEPVNIANVWFAFSDFESTDGTTPDSISVPIKAACASAAKARIGQIENAVKNSCGLSAQVLADAYGVSSKSKQKIAQAIAQDFQESLWPLVIPLCIQYIK